VTIAYVGVGSNEDDPRRHVERALDELGRLPGTRLLKKSSLYRSAPVGFAAQPEFINAVAAVDTELPALELLHALQGVEARHGRRRSFRNAPRTLDLDLLLYGDMDENGDELNVPHPRMHERAFVLLPLLEIAPAARVPRLGEARALLAACTGQGIEKLG
jgi:2-amino-4-hydroxy-6-hydroxymethyldihydropteridine diphosphokinase